MAAAEQHHTLVRPSFDAPVKMLIVVAPYYKDIADQLVAGAQAEVAAVLDELGEKGQRLSVSHAFHSPLMMPMAEEYRAVVALLSESGALSGSPPQVPVVSTVTGDVASAKELADPEHWVRQVWSPVLFSGALEAALGQWSGEEFNPCVVLEVGPNPVLSRPCLSIFLKKFSWISLHSSLLTINSSLETGSPFSVIN